MVHLPLTEMSVEEKLEVMEALWRDLCSQSEHVPSPDWHATVLARRADALARGEEIPEEWDAAKRKIRQIFS